VTELLLAHGLGDAGDLPLPLPAVLYLCAGVVVAAAALTARREARATGAGDGLPERRDVPGAARRLPRLGRLVDHPVLRAVGRGLVLVAAAVVIWAAAAGPPEASLNPAPRLTYVVFWATLVPSALLLGHVWRAVNPWRTIADGIARLSGDPHDEAVEPLSPGVGVWPAAVQLAVFAYFQTMLADSASVLLLLLVGLTLVQVAAANRYGRVWFAHGDPFEVLTGIVARLAPLGRDGDGQLVWRRPGSGMAGLTRTPGLLAVLAIVMGTQLHDFLLDTPLWHGWRGSVGSGLLPLVDGATLVGAMLLCGVAMHLAVRPAPYLVGAFVPVMAGYALAHDLGIVPVEGQFAFIQLSDPLARGWDLLGLSGRFVPLEPVDPTVIVLVIVGVLLAAHVAAVLLAHAFARQRHDVRVARAVQLPLRSVLVVSVVGVVAARLIVA
jgi:hypothetical protein